MNHIDLLTVFCTVNIVKSSIKYYVTASAERYIVPSDRQRYNDFWKDKVPSVSGGKK